MVFACVKYLTVNFIRQQDQVFKAKNSTGEAILTQYIDKNITISVGFIIFGNLIDNTAVHAKMVACCDLILSVVYAGCGLLFAINHGE